MKLAKKIEVTPGRMNIELSRENLACTLGIDLERLNENSLQIQLPFQFRKRGVETRLVFGAITNQVDAILVRNIARAHSWFDAIKSGQTFDEIAERDLTSKRRVQQIIKLAFLAPNIVRSIVEGKQPIGLTSDWLLRHDFPVEWCKRRELIATL